MKLDINLYQGGSNCVSTTTPHLTCIDARNLRKIKLAKQILTDHILIFRKDIWYVLYEL